MQHFESIASYYKAFGHSPNKETDFDARSFEQYYEEDKKNAVVFNLEPFRVEFIALNFDKPGIGLSLILGQNDL